MKKLFIFLFIIGACNPGSSDKSKYASEEITKADIAMSNMAASEGFFKALLFYAEDSMIIPREGKVPLMSKVQAETAWEGRPVIKELSWRPVKAYAAKNGDMGYTFGYATYKGKDTVTYTNYCTIWRRQADGSWKFVFDGGNNTPKPE